MSNLKQVKMSKTEMGYHTPKVTTEVSKRLLESKIQTQDLSWKNDEGDSLGIVGWYDAERFYAEGMIWIPYGKKYKHFTLVIQDNDDGYEDLQFDTIEEVIKYIKNK
tara:strand:- start:331 stop:651 length:321 start_codon:yes stop_codon:yes gene_type:complete